MSYLECNGEVILRMSREDYDWLLIILGAATANFGVYRVTQLLDRLNEGNPNYTPYKLATKSADGGPGPGTRSLSATET